MYLCVSGIDFVFFSDFLMEFGTDPTVLYLFVVVFFPYLYWQFNCQISQDFTSTIGFIIISNNINIINTLSGYPKLVNEF